MTKLNRKQAEHVRAWLCSQIHVDSMPDSFWRDMREMGIDEDAASEYIIRHHNRIFVDMGQPQFLLGTESRPLYL